MEDSDALALPSYSSPPTTPRKRRKMSLPSTIGTPHIANLVTFAQYGSSYISPYTDTSSLAATRSPPIRASAQSHSEETRYFDRSRIASTASVGLYGVQSDSNTTDPWQRTAPWNAQRNYRSPWEQYPPPPIVRPDTSHVPDEGQQPPSTAPHSHRRIHPEADPETNWVDEFIDFGDATVENPPASDPTSGPPITQHLSSGARYSFPSFQGVQWPTDDFDLPAHDAVNDESMQFQPFPTAHHDSNAVPPPLPFKRPPVGVTKTTPFTSNVGPPHPDTPPAPQSNDQPDFAQGANELSDWIQSHDAIASAPQINVIAAESVLEASSPQAPNAYPEWWPAASPPHSGDATILSLDPIVPSILALASVLNR